MYYKPIKPIKPDKDTTINIVVVITLGAIGVVVMFGIFSLIKYGVEKNELRECRLWAVEEANFEYWQAPEWMIDQCDHYEINLR